jgi:hydroxymethylpyrimidine/phosphomethylpyrimidine kinase
MTKPCVLVFAGLDPSGGAGIQADIQAISATGAHPLPIITALTVQDNQHVYAVHPVESSVLREQAAALIKRVRVSMQSKSVSSAARQMHRQLPR